MQTQADFIFHLDEPREQFSGGRQRLRGWIATHETLSELYLLGKSERLLRHEERPDIRRAFPNFSCATGFLDEVTADDLHHGELRLGFTLGAAARTAIEILAPAPRAPSGMARARLNIAHWLAKRRAGWNAALSALLLEIQLERGN